VQTVNVDIAIVGAGGGGLRAAIAAAQANPNLKIALVSKVYPMRSHTVAAEGGAAAVIKEEDSYDKHFHDTVAGGDWLCEQDVVEYFVEHSPVEMTQLERWGCPWSRKADGDVNVRRFGGMKIERTWFAADKTGFHLLHTLFQTSIQYPQIIRFDEHFVLDILVDDGHARGMVAMNMMEGSLVQINANAVVIATGGGCRAFRFNTNGGIVTGDGLSMAYRHGVPLRDMEFVQYHPTGLPNTGILMTEGCRGEGGILVNKDGYRYLQDYGLGPETPIGKPENKYMELGPRDKVSQAFWQEWRKGNTLKTAKGVDVVHLDLRHLGEKYLHERLPFICELAKAYEGVDPAQAPIPVRPVVHYTMGGIEVDFNSETRIKGLFAVGECASSGLHGANRLGSNSLAELVVLGRVAGEYAAQRAIEATPANQSALDAQAQDIVKRLSDLYNQEGTESWSEIRDEMGQAMEEGCGIYRTQESMQQAVDKIAELKERYKHIRITDRSSVFNTNLLYTVELGYILDVAQSIANSAIERKESRGAHQRLDYTERDDVNYLKHTLAFYNENASLLDALGYIKDKLEPELSYRWSCRMAICGSCGMMVNNIPKLACKTFLRDYSGHMRIEALANFPIERDLIVDLSHFIESLEAIKPYVIGNKAPELDGKPHPSKELAKSRTKQTPAQLEKYRQFSMCINCGLCYAACPQFGLNPEFVGPAVLTLGHRYNLDNRDHGKAERMKIMNGENGVWSCTFVGACSEVCPKHVGPATAINQGKLESAKDYLISMLKPKA